MPYPENYFGPIEQYPADVSAGWKHDLKVILLLSGATVCLFVGVGMLL
jgi:hypothetical protein